MLSADGSVTANLHQKAPPTTSQHCSNQTRQCDWSALAKDKGQSCEIWLGFNFSITGQVALVPEIQSPIETKHQKSNILACCVIDSWIFRTFLSRTQFSNGPGTELEPPSSSKLFRTNWYLAAICFQFTFHSFFGAPRPPLSAASLVVFPHRQRERDRSHVELIACGGSGGSDEM